MNKNKRGSPFEFLKSFIDFAVFFEDSLQLAVQTITGRCKEIVKYVPGLKSADYTTSRKRIRATEFELEQLGAIGESESSIVALDTRGIKVTKRGKWMKKMEKRGKWMKVHISASIKAFLVISDVCHCLPFPCAVCITCQSSYLQSSE